jgi:hypothetical protein
MLYLQNLRRQRGLTEKLFLLDVVKETEEKKIILQICGTTKNVYTIKIEQNDDFYDIKCDCYDAQTNCLRDNLICKHVCFVYCKILKELGVYTGFYELHQLNEYEYQRLLFNLDCLRSEDSIIDNELTTKFKK